MKIAVIGHLKFPIAKPFAGGLESFTYMFVEALVARGHQVTLFAAADSDFDLPLVPICKSSTIAASKNRLGKIEDEWIECVEDEAYENLMARLSTDRYDVIHNHSLSPIPLQCAGLLSTKLLTTLHTPLLPRMADVLRRRGQQNCGEFINISRSNARRWKSVLPNQTIIHNGVDCQFWNACHRRRKQKRAIWFGRIVADKGTHLAVQAAHRAGLPIDVVGPIADADYFRTEVAPRLSAQDNYLGHRTHEELCDLIGRSSVALVTPCWDEPFGLVVAEALACGTPVAAFARGALPELLTPEVGRLAVDCDVDALADAARHCLALSGRHCRELAEQRYSLDHMIDRYETVYHTHSREVAA